MGFFEMGFSLANLFELADDEDLDRKPDAIYLFGVPEKRDKIPKNQRQFFMMMRKMTFLWEQFHIAENLLILVI